MIKQVKFAKHQDEITAMMMAMRHLETQTVDIPVARYIELDDMGVLKPFAWFDGDTIKGIALLFVSPSLRNQSIVDASTDVIWVTPEYRGNSSEFIDGIKVQLKAMGVNYWYISSRDTAPIDGFLTKNNFEPLERLYFVRCKMGFVKDAFNGITGKTGAKAAEKAGQLQSDSSQYAADLSQKQFEQTRNDQMPWLEAGKGALGQLQDYISKNNNFDDRWGGRIESAYQNGQLTGGLDPSKFQTDPSYQFRKQQGMADIESSAAASGGLLSGAALKSLNRYNSDLASQEYGNAWGRDQAEKKNLFSVLGNNRSQDYDLFNNEDTRKYNQISAMAGVGQTTANNLGTFGANNAAQQGDYAVNGANMQANALMGAAGAKTNAWNNILGMGMKAMGNFV